IAYCNPFLPDRIEYERAGSIWSASVADPAAPSPNVARLHTRLGPMIETVQARLENTPDAAPQDLAIYEECVHHLLYQRYYKDFTASSYGRFAEDWRRLLPPSPADNPRFETALLAPHFFACFRQVQRAFHHIFDNIVGNSMPAARLRASAWQSVFTHDLRRYRRTLYARMRDFPTLIAGPSGTGKE